LSFHRTSPPYQQAGSQSREVLWLWEYSTTHHCRGTSYGGAAEAGTPLARAAASRFRPQFLGESGKGTQSQTLFHAGNKQKVQPQQLEKAKYS